MKIALVHDFLREYGGAERVVETFHEMYPDAPLYTAFVDFKSLGRQAERFRNWDIRTSWVQGNSVVKRFISPLRFLAPKIWASFDLSEYDVVISSSGWFMCRGVALNSSKLKVQSAKLIKNKLYKPVHICYIHHPPRNLYGYATGSNLQKYPLVRVYTHVVNFFLRQYDYKAAQAVDFFIANSKETARRVKKFYRRESTVVYPPVTVNGEQLTVNGKSNRTYYLSVGRLTYAKRIDLAIMACNTLKLPLKVVGTGKEEKYLRSIAGKTIEFPGPVPDGQLAALYAGAKALIFCALDEDFGMVPVEAMARGTPVIALAQGGVKETVIDGKTGVLFDQPESESLAVAIRKFESIKHDWAGACRTHAEKFGREVFVRKIRKFVDRIWQL
jgi:glycosyltransferase involved in cell wall biosynthesis